jgi:serine protease AprX
MTGIRATDKVLRGAPGVRRPQDKRSLNWRSILVATALCVSLTPLLSRASAHAQVLHASPSLLQAAERHPHGMLNVIVEKRGSTAAPETMIREAGGRVGKSLWLINSVAATIPASALGDLASSTSVNWVAPDSAVHHEGGSDGVVNTANLLNKYDSAIGARRLWSQGYQGAGVNVAVVDSGVSSTSDVGGSRILASVSTSATDPTTTDGFGHGSHVAGLIGSNGSASNGQYIGIAPQSGIVSVKVFNGQGLATVSDVVNGLQWIYNNRSTYNIKIVNLSLDTTLAQSYNVDPLDAACEVLWFNSVVVVVAAGNSQSHNPGVLYSPANDPFVITVGAVDDHGTVGTSDDTLASFSSYGTTVDGFAKPDLMAPGVDLISTLASPTDLLAQLHPSHINGSFFDMSGTSMAAPVVSGAAALLLETDPSLNPDQVKSRLMSTATQLSSSTGTGAGEVNVYAASQSSSTATANTGLAPSAALTVSGGTTFSTWTSASWGSASWGSASWGSASWGSASWGSSSWDSDYWGKTKKHPHGDDKGKDGKGSQDNGNDNVKGYNG